MDAVSQPVVRFLGDDFFVDGEVWGVEGGSIRAEVETHREGNLYRFLVTLGGTLVLECDRCLEPFDLPMGFRGVLAVQRMSGGESRREGEEWAVPDSSNVIDIAPFIRESLYLSIPMRHYHGMAGTDEADCNLERVASVSQETGNSERALGAQLGSELAAVRAKLAGEDLE